MENTLVFGGHSRGTNSLTLEPHFSSYSLRRLFTERYWIDAKSESARGRYLEREIQKRCAFIRERTNRTPSAATESGARFRPYGFIVGVVCLACSIGPYVAAEFLYFINVFGEANGDTLSLSGVWALLTLPFAVLGFLIGGMMDAARVVKWFDLFGRQDTEPTRTTDLPVEHQSPRDALSDIHLAGLSKTY